MTNKSSFISNNDKRVQASKAAFTFIYVLIIYILIYAFNK